jgi:natural product biosynthesis luciferase-like monooxygenase protein
VNIKATSAVFVGDGTLLIQCAQAYIDAGHDIRAVATANADIHAWAVAQGIEALQFDDTKALELPAAAFDFLFSIANLRMLPAQALARAGKLAINFHDGPLPRYAGLNATAWALLAREQMHGVTWHEMTPEPDAGRIVRQVQIPVAHDETALSLNTKCYAAGHASFVAMLDDIARGQLTLSPQQGTRSYFSRDRRPEALATLDFAQPAEQLAATVRALDHGEYANALSQPKVWLGDGVLLVRTATVADSASHSAPGTVLSVDRDSLRIATGRGDIVLGGCRDPSGRADFVPPQPGAVLAPPSTQQFHALQVEALRTAKSERFWRAEFTRLAPVDLPYPASNPATRTSQQLHAAVGAQAAGTTTVAAFGAWLAALTGQENVTTLYGDAALAAQAEDVQAWLSPWVPLTLQFVQGCTPVEAASQAEVAIARVREAGPYVCDLPWRLGVRGFSPDRLGRIAVSLCGPTKPANVDLLLTVDESGALQFVASADVYSARTLRAIAAHFGAYLKAFEAADCTLAEVSLLPADESEAIAKLNDTSVPLEPLSICAEISAQVARTPERDAVRDSTRALTYRQLDEQSTALARRLVARGAGPGQRIGVCLARSVDLVVALLAVIKSGAAYVPLDPDYPAARLRAMVDDSLARFVVTHEVLADLQGQSEDANASLPEVDAASPAYVIYTSGSTGAPKGVVVTHRNVANFFAGMDARVPHEPPGTWLAVTSPCFDISVLELFWTLARGFTVAMHSNQAHEERKPCEFSLFYFASDDAAAPSPDRYKLLMEGARFADSAGFSAIWTPERHFHAFGGLYPNPALTSAVIAAITTNLKIRAGSCVLPLHHPLRVAEEWAFVDNISHGRVGVSFASGWQPNDFVLAPSAFANRKSEMLANIDVVRRLWRGESVAFPGPSGKPVEVRTLPRPVQKELPIWVTAAGNPETFEQAGEQGCHLLTHLLGQRIDDVAQKLKLYRAAWRKAGHAGDGHVTLMLHTFVGQDEFEVRETVRAPMKAYLRSSIDLIKQAAWTFPTFVQRGEQQGKSPLEIMESAPLSDADMDALLEHAFARYYGTSSLFGTPQRCLAMVEQLRDAGVDEIACLIDFGVATDTVLEHLHDLKELMDAASKSRPAFQQVSVAESIARFEATHLQCTPSMASMLVADAAGRAALSQLTSLLVGGEALPLPLATQLGELVAGTLLNMYGPTETTIWSSVCNLQNIEGFVPLGEPIANTRLSIRTPSGRECPALVAGELFIAGEGVAAGYWERPELTADRFKGGYYRTGDLVRRHVDGRIEFLGRTDHQLKIRGHRIEPGEIEAALVRQQGVKQAIVIARDDIGPDTRLVAYVAADANVEAAALREALAADLPAVMVPAVVMVLPALPMTLNGKLDRRALPLPTMSGATPRAVMPPQGDVEKLVASIWQQVLGLPEVGTTDNFFDLGGHSLLVVQVQRRLREAAGHEVSITDMFRFPTIASLAAHIGGVATNSVVDDAVNRAMTRRQLRSRSAARPAPVA